MPRPQPEFEELRRRIERLRRRIDRSVSRLTDRTVRWVGWQSYVTRYPVRSLAAAVGIGFVLATLASRFRWPRRFGARLFDFACRGAWTRVWALLRRVRFTDADESPHAVTGETADE